MHLCPYLHWHHHNRNHHHRHHANCWLYHITTWNCWSWQSSWVGWHSAPKREQLNTWVRDHGKSWVASEIMAMAILVKSGWTSLPILICNPDGHHCYHNTKSMAMVIPVVIIVILILDGNPNGHHCCNHNGHGDIWVKFWQVVFYWCSPEVPSTATCCYVALSLLVGCNAFYLNAFLASHVHNWR